MPGFANDPGGPQFRAPGFLQPKTFEAIDRIPQSFDEMFDRVAKAKAYEEQKKVQKKNQQNFNAMQALKDPLGNQLGQLPIEEQQGLISQAQSPQQVEVSPQDVEFSEQQPSMAEENSLVPQLRERFDQMKRGREIGAEKEELGLKKERLDIEALMEKSESGGLEGRERIRVEDIMGKRFEGLSKPFFLQRDSIGRVRKSAENPSPAGDLALIFNYMKILDPGSTVREGEFATAQNSGSVPQILRAKYNNVIEGTRLDNEQRIDFLDRAESLYSDAVRIHNVRRKDFQGLARISGARPEAVVLGQDEIAFSGGLTTEEEAERQELLRLKGESE